MKTTTLTALATAVALTACGGLEPSGATPPPASASASAAAAAAAAEPSVDDSCASLCDREARCAGADSASCLARCARLSAALREGLLASAGRCAAHEQCGDDCFAAARVELEGEHGSELQVRCLAARQRCRDEGAVVDAQRCTVAASLGEPHATLAGGCFAEPCDRIDACLEAAGALSLR